MTHPRINAGTWSTPARGGLTILLLAAAGCPPRNSEPPPAPAPPPPNTARAAVTPLYRYPSYVPIADSLSVRNLVDRSQGHVVMLYFWSRYSADCRLEMPRVVELQQKYADAGLKVIACNVDDPADWEGQTRPLLMSVRGNFPCVVTPEPAREPLRTWLDSRWQYEWPAAFVFSRQGVRTAAVYSASASIAAEIEIAVREQLGRGDSEPTTAEGANVEARLIDVRAARVVRSFPAFNVASGEAIDLLAGQIAKQVSSTTRRVAVLPFVSRSKPDAAAPDGAAAADRLVRDLRLAGLTDIVEPAAALAKLGELRVSTVDVELDPAKLAGRWNVDYVVIGWWTVPRPASNTR